MFYIAHDAQCVSSEHMMHSAYHRRAHDPAPIGRKKDHLQPSHSRQQKCRPRGNEGEGVAQSTNERAGDLPWSCSPKTLQGEAQFQLPLRPSASGCAKARILGAPTRTVTPMVVTLARMHELTHARVVSLAQHPHTTHRLHTFFQIALLCTTTKSWEQKNEPLGQRETFYPCPPAGPTQSLPRSMGL